MGTFERELSDGLAAEASRVDPDVAAARKKLDARLASETPGSGPTRSSFLAVAAAAIVVAGGALAYQFSGGSSDQVDATDMSVLPDTPEPTGDGDGDETGDPTPTTSPSTTQPEADAAASTTTALQTESASDETSIPWEEVPAPAIDRSVGNALQIESREWKPQDPDGVTQVETIIWADDGRSLKLVFGDYAPQPETEWLAALVAHRGSAPDDAVHAMLRTASVNPDTATRNTIETRTWGMAGSLLMSGSLGSDEWADVLRALSTIDGVTISEETTPDGERHIVVEAANRPGGETWTMVLNGESGLPIEESSTGSDGSILRFVEYSLTRTEVPPPTPNAPASEAGVSISLSHLGVHLDEADEETILILGSSHEDVAEGLTASLGAPSAEAQSCQSRLVPQAELIRHSWPGVMTFENRVGQFTGWSLTDNDVITTDDGLGVGSPVGDLQALYPGLSLEPGPDGVSTWIDRVSYVATSDNPTSLLTEVSVGEICDPAGTSNGADEPSSSDGPANNEGDANPATDGSADAEVDE